MYVPALLTICFIANPLGAAGPLQCLTACEKAGDLLTDQTIGQVEVACPADETITIISALYGRKESSTCPTVTIDNPAYSTDCAAATAPDKVSALCDGKESCTVNATTEVFGDPCSKTEKYLTVCYVCISASVNVTALEEKVKTLCDKVDDLEAPPVFNCIFVGSADTIDPLKPYSICDVNEDDIMDPAAGVFTAPKPGKYRLTFMSEVTHNKKNHYMAINNYLVKSSNGAITRIAQSVMKRHVQPKEALSKFTITIDIIHELKANDTVHVEIERGVSGEIVGTADYPQTVTFTGQFIRS